MGINIGGFATSLKSNDLKTLTDQIGVKISDNYVETIFEDALSSSMDDDDVFFTELENGCIVTGGNDFDFFTTSCRILSANNQKVLKFGISETSTAYFFEYIKDEKILRRKMSVNYETEMDEGKHLMQEFMGLPDDELIDELLIDVCGEGVYTISPDTKTHKFKLVDNANG